MNVLDFRTHSTEKPKIKRSKKPFTLQGKRVCLTGKVPGHTRVSAMNVIQVNLGGIPCDSVTKTTDYLIIARDPGRGKRQKARDYGINTITWDQVKELLKRT